MTTLQAVALAIVLIAIANTYFLFDSTWRYFRVRHPIMLALLVVKAVIWSVGIAFGVIAARVAVGLPGLPSGGMVLAWGILGILLLPAFIWAVMRRFRA
jgi:hypothetical protein